MNKQELKWKLWLTEYKYQEYRDKIQDSCNSCSKVCETCELFRFKLVSIVEQESLLYSK